MNVFGIYVGNSSASIAISKEDGKVEILANDSGERVTPAVVKISNSEQVVGSAAVVPLASNTVTRNKTLVDRSLSEERLDALSKLLGVRTELEAGRLVYHISDDDKIFKYTPLRIASLIFKTLLSIGQSALPGQKELSCVLCVPRDWDDRSKADWLEAAESVGWKVLQLISEAPAATLAYSLDSDTSSMNVLVYRLGGVSCNATVIEFHKGFQSVLSSINADDIGGEQLVTVVTKHLAEEFKRKFHLDPAESRKSMGKLRVAAESMIRILSTMGSCSKFIESVCEGIDWSASLSRARLDAIAQPCLPILLSPIHRALESANVEISTINKVILCGGPLKIPRLISYAKSLFPPEAEFLLKLSPDEVFASGAAVQGGYLLSSPMKDIIKTSTFRLPILARPIRLQFSSGDEMTLRDEIVPCSASLSIGLKDAVLSIRAEQQLENGNVISGKVDLGDFEPPATLEVIVKVTLENELHIEVKDPLAKKVKNAVVEFKIETI